MKLISWNVNGLRACVQKNFMEDFEKLLLPQSFCTALLIPIPVSRASVFNYSLSRPLLLFIQKKPSSDQ